MKERSVCVAEGRIGTDSLNERCSGTQDASRSYWSRM
jgi:hypothetical protein